MIDYVLDVKIPVTIVSDNEEFTEEFLLRIERRKNYYKNSLSFCLKDVFYKVEGYDLRELLNKMQKKLPEEYCMGDYFSYMFGGHYLNLFNIESKNQFKKLQRVPITYISDDYCLS